MSLCENKPKVFENLLSGSEEKLTQQPISMYQFAGENGKAYSPRQCSSHTDEDIMYNKLENLWNGTSVLHA